MGLAGMGCPAQLTLSVVSFSLPSSINTQCELDFYNNVEEQWRLLIKDTEVMTESSTTEPDTRVKTDKLWMTAVDVDMKVKEKGWKRKRGML